MIAEWAEYPLCFDTIDDYRAWVVFAKMAKENVSPCDDCTREFQERMQDQHRCNSTIVSANFLWRVKR